ncbi:MAG: hypothetical protein RPU15_08715 [Candidatus Sedimenticola sp. (ex Thyasira tokunagai)]
MRDIDPKVPIQYALLKVNGNQAELGRQLGVERASVNAWVHSDREYLPELQAHRFVKIFGEVSVEPGPETENKAVA